MSMVAQQNMPAATFTNSAQKRTQYLGQVPYDLGLSAADRRLVLRNSGYLRFLRLVQNVQFQYTTAGPTGTDPFAAYGGIVKWLRVRANNVGTLFDCSGEGAAVASMIHNQYMYGTGNMTPPPYNFVAAPALAATTDKWTLDVPLELPLANKPSPLGLYQTAQNSNETSLEVQFRPMVATAGTPGSGLYVGNGPNLQAGTLGFVDVTQSFYDPIEVPSAEPNLGYMRVWREFPYTFVSDGDTEIRLPPSNIYSRVFIWLVTGAAGAGALDGTHATRMQLRYGPNLPIYDQKIDDVVAEMARRYNVLNPSTGASLLPTGLYGFDLLEDSHDERDLIDSAATTDLRLVVTLSGANYTGGFASKVLVEQLIPLEIPAGG
jgi:hypothetical protein